MIIIIVVIITEITTSMPRIVWRQPFHPSFPCNPPFHSFHSLVWLVFFHPFHLSIHPFHPSIHSIRPHIRVITGEFDFFKPPANLSLSAVCGLGLSCIYSEASSCLTTRTSPAWYHTIYINNIYITYITYLLIVQSSFILLSAIKLAFIFLFFPFFHF